MAQTVGPNLNLTKAKGNQYETAVAINPNDNNHVFVVSRNEAGGLYTAGSNDGGVTWTSRLIARTSLPAPGDVPRAYGNASVAWDSFGNLFLAYLCQASVRAPTYVCLSVSKDAGATFYSPGGQGSVLLLPANPPSAPMIGDQPTVTTGPGSAGFPGSVWVTYWTSGGIAVSAAGVSGLGIVGPFTSWQPAQPSGVNFGDIAVGPDGQAMVTYGPNSGSSGVIYTNVKADGLGPNSFSAFTAAVPVNVGGFTSIPAQPNWGVDPEAGLAWDRSMGPHRGRVYLVYTDAPAAGSADTNIFVIYSDDMGATWSASVRVNDDTGTNSQFLPHISLDQSNGMIAVTWYDARNSALNNTARYFGAFSGDGGATFRPNLQIAVGTSDQARSPALLKKADYGDYTGSAFVNGRLIPAWADNSDSTGDNPDGAAGFDVYTAIVQVPFSDLSYAIASVSAASYTANAPLAPGMIAGGFGKALASGMEGAQVQPLPFTLADTTVTVKDCAGVERQAPLFYVAPTQINYLVPDGSALGAAAVTVKNGGQVAAIGTLQIDLVAPGIFTANMDGQGAPAAEAIAVAPDLTQTSLPVAKCGSVRGSCVAVPIDLGPNGTKVVLTLYGTGIRGRSSQAAVTVQISGMDAPVEYAGPQAQFAGLDQLNVVIPRVLAGSGEVDLTVKVDGILANTVRVAMK
jgi:uncharacterized protein (TIGR03437 family)